MQPRNGKLLIVTDMQNDFITGALGTSEAQAVVGNVCEKIRAFDGEILFTMDTHNETYMDTQEGKRLPVPHCIAGTDGWAPNAAVWMALMDRDAADETHMVMKHGFGATELPIRIHETFGDDITEITLVGLCTDICVISNAMLLKAFFPEARIVIDASCCAGVTPQSHNVALAAMEAVQMDVVGR